MKNRITFRTFWAFFWWKSGRGQTLKDQNENLIWSMLEQWIRRSSKCKDFGPTPSPSGAFRRQFFFLNFNRIFKFPVSLLFWVPHPQLWLKISLISNVEFNSKSIGTNLKFKKKKKSQKEKSSCVIFYFSFFGGQFRTVENSPLGPSEIEKLTALGKKNRNYFII